MNDALSDVVMRIRAILSTNDPGELVSDEVKAPILERLGLLCPIYVPDEDKQRYQEWPFVRCGVGNGVANYERGIHTSQRHSAYKRNIASIATDMFRDVLKDIESMEDPKIAREFFELHIPTNPPKWMNVPFADPGIAVRKKFSPTYVGHVGYFADKPHAYSVSFFREVNSTTKYGYEILTTIEGGEDSHKSFVLSMLKHYGVYKVLVPFSGGHDEGSASDPEFYDSNDALMLSDSVCYLMRSDLVDWDAFEEALKSPMNEYYTSFNDFPVVCGTIVWSVNDRRVRIEATHTYRDEYEMNSIYNSLEERRPDLSTSSEEFDEIVDEYFQQHGYPDEDTTHNVTLFPYGDGEGMPDDNIDEVLVQKNKMAATLIDMLLKASTENK